MQLFTELRALHLFLGTLVRREQCRSLLALQSIAVGIDRFKLPAVLRNETKLYANTTYMRVDGAGSNTATFAPYGFGDVGYGIATGLRYVRTAPRDQNPSE